jgi:hypothetical protein
MDANVILVDRIANVTVANGVLRLECVSMSSTDQEKASGTVLIPVVVAGQVVQGLVNAMQDLDKKVREAAAASAGTGYPTTIPTGSMTFK